MVTHFYCSSYVCIFPLFLFTCVCAALYHSLMQMRVSRYTYYQWLISIVAALNDYQINFIVKFCFIAQSYVSTNRRVSVYCRGEWIHTNVDSIDINIGIGIGSIPNLVVLHTTSLLYIVYGALGICDVFSVMFRNSRFLQWCIKHWKSLMHPSTNGFVGFSALTGGSTIPVS